MAIADWKKTGLRHLSQKRLQKFHFKIGEAKNEQKYEWLRFSDHNFLNIFFYYSIKRLVTQQQTNHYLKFIKTCDKSSQMMNFWERNIWNSVYKDKHTRV